MKINQEILDAGRAEYEKASGLADWPRDENGFLMLVPKAKKVDEDLEKTSTKISTIEAQLQKYKEEKKKLEKYKETDIYKKSKKQSKKKIKEQKQTLLDMVFNNADHANDEDDDIDEEDEANYKEIKKRTRKKETTLDTTYGKRFSPVVSMLHDTITEFDQIAMDIESDLKEVRGKSMYRTSQIGNLISAKNSKLSAVRELASVATTVSNLEYKKEKDAKIGQESDSNKAVASLAAKYLRGSADDFDEPGSKKGKKNKKGDKKSSYRSSPLGSRKIIEEDDDDDEDYSPSGKIKKPVIADDDHQTELARAFADTLMKRKDEISFTPHEKYSYLDGKYTVAIVVDPLDTSDWNFIALDNKGEEIKEFRDKYKSLLPKKKECKMVFDVAKARATDKKTARTYKLLFK